MTSFILFIPAIIRKKLITSDVIIFVTAAIILKVYNFIKTNAAFNNSMDSKFIADKFVLPFQSSVGVKSTNKIFRVADKRKYQLNTVMSNNRVTHTNKLISSLPSHLCRYKSNKYMTATHGSKTKQRGYLFNPRVNPSHSKVFQRDRDFLSKLRVGI